VASVGDVPVTRAMLHGVRDELRALNDQTNARLDETNARLGQVDARFAHLEARLEAGLEENRGTFREIMGLLQRRPPG
jgi:transposase-like protein